jgi:hypothetical protein
MNRDDKLTGVRACTGCGKCDYCKERGVTAASVLQRSDASKERLLKIIDELTRDNAGLIAALDAAQAEARKMMNEHGQSWNSISGRRIMQAIDNAVTEDAIS